MRIDTPTVDWSGVLTSWRTFWTNQGLDAELMTRSIFRDVQILGCDYAIGDLVGWWRKGEKFDQEQARKYRMYPERLAESKFAENVGTRQTAIMLWNTRDDLDLTATVWIGATLLTLGDHLNRSQGWTGMEWVSTYLSAARDILAAGNIQVWAPRTNGVLPISILDEFQSLANKLPPYKLPPLAAFMSMTCKFSFDIVHVH